MAKRSSKRTAPSKSAPSISKREPKASRPFAPGYGIVGAKDGKGLLPWTWVAKKMKACRTFWLATVRETGNGEQGRPHVMPVWGVWLDDAFYFSTGKKSRKGQNLASNPACTVTNDDGEEAVIVEGRASVAKESLELERVATAYVKKYKMDPRGMGEPIFQVDPYTVFGFVEKSFPQSATRWKVR
jgi:nitroimidazol reductase NimA-like FMN-containing flavoprotein (pyridoxamine 5'-phosphate oxidase superfamily)